MVHNGTRTLRKSIATVALSGSLPDKLEFTRLYNGACTRLGDRELNAAVNAFIDQMIANGDLDKPYQKWMNMAPPPFPASVEGVPFTVA